MISTTARTNSFDSFLILIVCLIFSNGILEFSESKEITPTKEWQLIEGNDTVPAGFHVRMDMTTGEKWVKILDASDDDFEDKNNNGDAGVSVAMVETNGNVKIEQNGHDEAKTFRNSPEYNFEMMYETLSKLPLDEFEQIGGLPEFQDESNGSLRVAFEEQMLQIWEKRQAELLELELNFPEILKARISGIKDYLGNPEIQLENLDLDSYSDEDTVSDIVSLLKDLEFQLSDIDMTRDFHTMNGWPLLVKLLTEDTHSTNNTTINDLPANIMTKIRTVQSHAAWVIGTAVKNTEEFFPYGVEPVVLKNIGSTSAIDVLITIFCNQYDDLSWETRTLLARTIYAIGAILRGNHLALKHIAETNGFNRLGNKFRELSQQGFDSANAKLIQRMATLSADIVEFAVDPDMPGTNIDISIVNSITSAFCDVLCLLSSSDTFLPVTVQEALMRGIAVMGSYCQASNCRLSSISSFVETIKSDWSRNQERFDADHFQELLEIAMKAIQSLGLQTSNDEHDN